VDFAGVLTGNNIKADFAKFPHVKIMNCLQELI
jgi:phosphoglycolate phosphatase